MTTSMSHLPVLFPWQFFEKSSDSVISSGEAEYLYYDLFLLCLLILKPPEEIRRGYRPPRSRKGHLLHDCKCTQNTKTFKNLENILSHFSHLWSVSHCQPVISIIDYFSFFTIQSLRSPISD